MTTPRLLCCLLLLSVLAAAQSYTLYYSDTSVVNGDGSITVTPTLSISGDDGNYCSFFFDYFKTQERAGLMLNGNVWSFTVPGSSATEGRQLTVRRR